MIEWSRGGMEPAPAWDATTPASELPDAKVQERDVPDAPDMPERQRPRQVREGSKSAGKTHLRDRVRAVLTERYIPFVDVDEAERALFQSAKLRSFHIVAYSKEGPNWLIFRRDRDRPIEAGHGRMGEGLRGRIHGCARHLE